MPGLYLGAVGLLAFVVGVALLGVLLRKAPTKENAERYSRIAHFLFFAGLWAPGTLWVFYPGLTHLDELSGLDPLPLKLFFLVAGIVVVLPGAYLLAITNKLLRTRGNGANAFNLTKQIVEDDIYKRVRNPMSLGYYLICLGIGFISGSTLLTLCVLLGLIPAHIFFLMYFEELELGIRFGAPYLEYKRTTPLLIPRLLVK